MKAEASRYREFRVWNGYQWMTTWAVSDRQAVSNVAWRLRRAGKLPVMSAFEVEEVKHV